VPDCEANEMKRRKRVIDAASESIRQSVTGEKRVEMMENEEKGVGNLRARKCKQEKICFAG
jgi:hypothetical protein